MPFSRKYYTLYIWHSHKKHYQFTHSPLVLQQKTHKGTPRSKALEGASSDTEAPLQVGPHSSREGLAVSSPALDFRPHPHWLPASLALDFRPHPHLTSGLTRTWLPASPALDFRPHPPVPDSGPYSWCIWHREALGKTGHQEGRRCWTPLPHSTEHPCPPTSGSSSISFFRFPTQTSFCRLCFLFRREFCPLTGR